MEKMSDTAPLTAAQYVDAESWVELPGPAGSMLHRVLLHIGPIGGDPTKLGWATAEALTWPGRDTCYQVIRALVDRKGRQILGVNKQQEARRLFYEREGEDLDEQDRQYEQALADAAIAMAELKAIAEGAIGAPNTIPITFAIPVTEEDVTRLILPRRAGNGG